eukprot:g7529.t1
MFQTEEEFSLWFNALKYILDETKSQTTRIQSRGLHRSQNSIGSRSMGTPLGDGQSKRFANQNQSMSTNCNIPGDCYIWGSSLNDKNQTLAKINRPQLVPSSQKLNIIQVSAGVTHFCVVTRSGHLYSWGSGPKGVLGLGSIQTCPTPTSLPDLSGVRSVSCGESVSLALREDGGVHSWGSGLTGQLGNGQGTTQYHPKILSFPHGVRITQVCCGPFHSGAICAGGCVYTWGDGFGGKLGHGTCRSELTPKRVLNLEGIIGVTCGYWHTAVWSGNPQEAMYTWGGVCTWGGDNNKGCLGNGAKTGELHPYKVESKLRHKSIKQVSCGLNLTIVLTGDGEVYQMGSTGAQDSDVPWDRTSQPTRVEGLLLNRRIQQIACGKQHMIAVGQSSQEHMNHLFSWGVGQHGQLGLGTYKDHTSPQLVEGLDFRRILHVCCGGDYSLVVCAHDHKVAASKANSMMDVMSLHITPDSSPKGHQSNRRTSRPNSNIITSATPMRMPVKKTVLAQMDTMPISLEHSTIPAGASIRKLRRDLSTSANSQRQKIGWNHLSEAKENEAGLRPRSQTPEEPSSPAGFAGGSSSDDESLANTEGHQTNDTYSDDDDLVSQDCQSERSMSSIEHSSSMNLVDNCFQNTICTFPPSSTEDHFQNLVSSAKLRSRQRGMERRLGVMDTWTCEQVISKHTSAPVEDLARAVQPIVDRRLLGVASWRPDDMTGHKRSASAEIILPKTLEDDSNKELQKKKSKLVNFVRFLSSLEDRKGLIQNEDANFSRGIKEELSLILSKLMATEFGSSEEIEIGGFFKLETIEKNQKTLEQISALLESMEPRLGPSNASIGEEATSAYEMRSKLNHLEKTLSLMKGLITKLQSYNSIEGAPSASAPNGASSSVEEKSKIPLVSDYEVLRHSDSGLVGPMLSNESENEPSTTSSNGQLVHLWMEKVDPGVSIIFQSTNNCKTKIKKIRFTKRMFAWEEAHRWWEANQEHLIKQYGLEAGYDPLQESNGDH